SLELNGNRFDAEGDAVELIKAALSENDLDDDILGSLSDMEELTDDEDEEDESDDEKDEAEQPTSAAKADEQLADLVDEMKKQLSI
ncbi:hypothetical protein GGH17_002938, partial [Coemansia sp. RSA 788]